MATTVFRENHALKSLVWPTTSLELQLNDKNKYIQCKLELPELTVTARRAATHLPVRQLKQNTVIYWTQF